MKQETADLRKARPVRMTMTAVLCAFLAGLPIGGDVFGIATTGPHGFKIDECTNCHVTVPSDGQKGPFRMRGRVSVLCRKCHPSGMNSFSHPVGFRPQGTKIPPEFPLSYDGRFTCSTCHDIHKEVVGASGFRSYYLRHRIGEVRFCVACHDKEPMSHENLLSAHMKKKMATTGELLIDEVSNQCLACHNGVNAKNIASGLPGCFCPEEQTGHPIGVQYETSGKKTKVLKHLDKSVKLYNGKLGCGTCHEPYSKNSKMLVIPNTGSALCLMCHSDY
ncbi:MAG TPA: cytochrome c3 family protein [Thermodesulfovibrionales bacterium]|nr:cytochrome c3 family protein [Thermodesulfovibrionales bacterium]